MFHSHVTRAPLTAQLTTIGDILPYCKRRSIWPPIIRKTFRTSVDHHPVRLQGTNTPHILPRTNDLPLCMKTVIT